MAIPASLSVFNGCDTKIHIDFKTEGKTIPIDLEPGETSSTIRFTPSFTNRLILNGISTQVPNESDNFMYRTIMPNDICLLQLVRSTSNKINILKIKNNCIGQVIIDLINITKLEIVELIRLNPEEKDEIKYGGNSDSNDEFALGFNHKLTYLPSPNGCVVNATVNSTDVSGECILTVKSKCEKSVKCCTKVSIGKVIVVEF